MSLGESMISTLNSNKNIMLDKSKRFKKTLGGYNPEAKTEYNFPKTSAKQLRNISKRLQEEHRLRMYKVVFVTLIIFLAIVCAFLYASDGVIELLTY